MQQIQHSALLPSVNDLFDRLGDQIDAVSILVPTAFHKDIAIQSLRFGKHVFCEKPPAINALQAKEMEKAAASTGKLLLFDFNNRFRPESLAIHERLQDGLFGKINSAQASWIRRSGIPAFGTWYTNKHLSGGGALIDLSHMIDLALFFMGFPKPSLIIGQTFTNFMDDPSRRGTYGSPIEGGICDVESAAHAFVRFENGQVLTIHCSWAEMIKKEECSVQFQGEKAGARMTRLFDLSARKRTERTCEIYSQKKGRPVTKKLRVPIDTTMGREKAAESFIWSVRGKSSKPLATVQESCRLMQIIDSIYQSAETGKPVIIN